MFAYKFRPHVTNWIDLVDVAEEARLAQIASGLTDIADAICVLWFECDGEKYVHSATDEEKCRRRFAGYGYMSYGDVLSEGLEDHIFWMQWPPNL